MTVNDFVKVLEKILKNRKEGYSGSLTAISRMTSANPTFPVLKNVSITLYHTGKNKSSEVFTVSSVENVTEETKADAYSNVEKKFIEAVFLNMKEIKKYGNNIQ